MTPKTSIKKECRYCKNGSIFECGSNICKLSPAYEFKTKVSTLKRIKLHCIDCIPEQSLQGVAKCDGKILNPESHDCPLHPYRLGHNPKLKGKGNIANLIFYKKHATKGGLES